ncbi:hypothetical protein ASF66_16320 [Pseudomonas sp. Leaf129]|nr:hypothetical protein ASF66_16320 [Pseudomonas sp. Leaf129]
MVFSIRCKGKLQILMQILEMGMLLSTVLRGVHYVMCLALGLRWSNGTKLRMEHISPRREVIQKFWRGMFLSRFLIAWGWNDENLSGKYF